MRFKSFAKINLGLEVIGIREDNYHEIRTLFQTIDFYDVLEFRETTDGQIYLRGDDGTIPWDENNLIYKAVLILKEQCHISKGIEISVKKKIPPGKGLGGGSSNAAVTLHALNIAWGLGLKKKELMDLGRKLGADVPYFLEGGLCLGLGRGDQIIPLEDLPQLYCLLALPDLSILTASVYEQHSSSLTSCDKDSKIIKFLSSRDFGLLENNLEETVLNLYPQIKAIKSLFRSLGPELSSVSGTGSSVFGLFLEKEKAERAFQEGKIKVVSLLVETISRVSFSNGLNAGV